MKRKSNYLVITMAFASIMFISSCSVNENIPDNPGTNVRFSGSIRQVATQQNTPEARVAINEWGNGDVLGIFMVSSGTVDVVENAVNRQYTTTAGTTGTFAAISGNEIYYPMNNSTVDFMAYYPFKSNATLDMDIDIVIGDQSNQPSFDLLWAKASGYKKETTDPVTLIFDHKLAKIVMNCKAEDNVGVANLEDMVVTIKGMNTQNTFKLTNGELGVAVAKGDIVARKIATTSGFQVSYDAIVMPGQYGTGDIKVEFVVNGETFIWDVKKDDADFVSGNEYIYEVTFTRTGVSATGMITPWITGGTNDRGPVTAE